MPNNKGKKWTNSQVSELKKLAKQGITTPNIAKKLGRTSDAIYNKASDENISLKPKD